ncbi:MAG: putative transposase [Azonexus sp.]
MDKQDGQKDFDWQQGLPAGAVAVNGRVWFQDLHGLRAVFVNQAPFYRFAVQNEVEKRFTAAQLVEAELASVSEVCQAFSLSPRTFSRIRRELQQGGVEALVKGPRGPHGRRPETQQLAITIVRLYEQHQTVYQIANRVGLCPRTVGRVLKDQGIARRGHRTASPPLFPDASSAVEPSESSSSRPCEAQVGLAPELADDPGAGTLEARELIPAASVGETADLAASEALVSQTETRECLAVTMAAGTLPVADDPDTSPRRSAAVERDTDVGTSELSPRVDATSIPYASPLDRLATTMGLIEEAPVSFVSAEAVPQAGVLLGLALLGETHLVEEARAVYGRLKNGWYGLRSLLSTLIAMALLRIKRPEQIKLQDPVSLGQVLGLPRSAEVKTIRRKVAEVAQRRLAAELHRRLAQRRAADHVDELATLYVDGHVRVYHGKHRLGKTYVTRLKSVARGETDYWVHLRSGRPLLVIHDAANGSFAKLLREQVLPEIRRVVGEQRVTVVFDRAGWCKELMWALLEANFDFITYRKGAYVPLDEKCFRKVTLQRDGHTVQYELAEGVFAEDGWPSLRLIAAKKKNGHQTHLVASGRATWEALEKKAEPDLPAEEIAWWMFGRWCQENWFKYMKEEFLLDVLVEYATEPDDPQREVVNPERRKLDRQLRVARARLNREEGKRAQLVREERKTRQKARGKARQNCGDCGKCARCCLTAQKRALAEARAEVEQLLQRREQTPRKIALGEASDRDPVKLSYERKLFTDTVKICAYEIETRLLEMALEEFRRGPWEGRSLIRDILQTSGNLQLSGETLEVHLDQLSTPRATRAMMSICDQLNSLRPQLPESPLQLRFFVNPRPVGE